MELASLNVSRGTAREAFLEYRHAVQASYVKEHAALDERRADIIRRQREVDEAVMAGYSAIARGKQVIDVAATVGAGGLDPAGRPAIALARADLERVSVRLDQDGSVRFDAPPIGGRGPRKAVIELPDGTLPRDPRRGWGRATAIVPTIPPRFRPDAQLDRFWLLFEAEYQAPPVDPALLRPLGGGLAVVLAVWDLSPLERTVLGMVR